MRLGGEGEMGEMGGKEVKLDEWLEAKRDILEFAYGFKATGNRTERR